MNLNKLNIIQFMPYFPPHKWWLETVWEEIGKYWVKNDYWEFINIVTEFNQDEIFEKSEKIIFENNIIWYKKDWYEVLVCPSFEIINNFPIYKIWDKKYKLIKKYLKNKFLKNNDEYKIITHTRFFLTSFIWWLFAKKNKLDWIHIEHWSEYVKLSSKIKSQISYFYDRIIGKWIFKKANKILAISKASKDFINNNFIKKNIDVFYRWIDLKELKWAKNWELKLVFIWRLVKLKWVDFLLKAYSEINLNMQIDIIWDWEELDNLIKLSSKLWINNKVNFLWFKNKEFINNYLSNNNLILINPSYQEWLPTTVIEWLFYKNIVIASNVWWTSEISSHNDLILFESWNIKELWKKIIESIKYFERLEWLSFQFINERFNRQNNIFKLYNYVK